MRYGMLINMDRCVGCAACVMACKVQNGTPAGTYWCNVTFRETGKYPDTHIYAMPMQCQHCANPKCVVACPTGASYVDENGNILINQEECIGCSACAQACPYDVRTLNTSEMLENPYFEGMESTPFEQLHAAEHPANVMGKCVRCYTRVAEGAEPACVKTCIALARLFGDVDDPASEIAKEIAAKGAWQYKADQGADPSIWYVGSKEGLE